MLPALAERSKAELLNTVESMKNRAKSMAQKAMKPAIQLGHGVSAVAGGAFGGAVSGMKPTVARVPTDAGLGLLIALPCLMGAGSPAVDAAAFAGYGMLAGAASRGTRQGVRKWREQRAADSGDSQAAQILQLQGQLDELRKQRDNPPVAAK